MKIDLTKQFFNLNGSELLENGQPLRLKDIAISCLLSMKEGENISAEEKVSRFSVAKSMYETQTPEAFEIKIEDLSLIKKLIGADYYPIIVGQAYQFLEG